MKKQLLNDVFDGIYYRFHSGITFTKSDIFNENKIWNTHLISDTHFNHYPKTWDWVRPGGWENMIIKNWNGIIRPNDTVIHLGDFGFGNKEVLKKTRDKLSGEIYLLKGNHDRHGIKWYADIGITMIKKTFSVNISKEIFVFSHRSIRDEIPDGMVNVHGHTHEKSLHIRDRKINISVEQINYTPIRLHVLLASWRLHKFKNEV